MDRHSKGTSPGAHSVACGLAAFGNIAALRVEPHTSDPYRLQLGSDHLVKVLRNLFRRPSSQSPHHRNWQRASKECVREPRPAEDLTTHVGGSLTCEVGD